MVANDFYRTLSRLWASWTTPHPSIKDIEQQQQSQLLAQMLLVVIVLDSLSVIMLLNGRLAKGGIFNFIVGLTIFLLVYALNHTGYYTTASMLFVIGNFVLIHVSALLEASPLITYSLLSLLAAGIFLSLRLTVALAIISIVSQLIFVIADPHAIPFDRQQSLVLISFGAPLLLIFIVHRTRIEHRRQEALRVVNRALEESETRWRTLVRNLPEFILELDTDYKIRFLNRHISGGDTQEYTDITVFDFAAPEYHGDIRAAFARARETHEAVEIELEVQDTIANNVGWYATVITPVMKDDEIHTWLLASRDTSERREAERQRLELRLQKERVELLTEFIGNVSHDLKTPLTMITTSLYLLDRIQEPERQREKLDAIRQQVELLEVIIHDILTLSQLEHTPRLQFAPVNLNQLLMQINAQFRTQAEMKRISMTLTLDESESKVLANVTQLNRALLNLVENAIKYTPEDGDITLRTHVDENHVIVEIQDTGVGIPPDDVPRIFERFFRADRTRQMNVGGSGLGLAITHKIIEMHAATIRVESVLEQGTTFKLEFPRTPAAR